MFQLGRRYSSVLSFKFPLVSHRKHKQRPPTYDIRRCLHTLTSSGEERRSQLLEWLLSNDNQPGYTYKKIGIVYSGNKHYCSVTNKTSFLPIKFFNLPRNTMYDNNIVVWKLYLHTLKM